MQDKIDFWSVKLWKKSSFNMESIVLPMQIVRFEDIEWKPGYAVFCYAPV